jgi:threonine synthase
MTMHRPGVIDRYRAFLPVSEATPVVTLQEGSTPHIRVPRLAEAAGTKLEVYIKYEGVNPTGSFKDRGMTLAVSKAVDEGSRGVICASTGNTAAAAAAYAARAGIKALVLLPAGSVALGKVSQALAYGATVVAVDGNFDKALELVLAACEAYPVTLVNSINPYRIEGQKTAAFEIVDALEEAPDFLFIPVGNAGNITAYWQGYEEYHAEKGAALPKMMGWQAAGAAPIVHGRRIDDPQTLATAIKIGNPASWKRAEAARDTSGGLIDMITDDEIVEAYKMLSTLEGVFVEPASAAGVAGLLKMLRDGRLSRDEEGLAVCVTTGHGLKDPERAIKTCPEIPTVAASLEAVAEVAGL